jgi:PDZ domain-containing secreted protein
MAIVMAMAMAIVILMIMALVIAVNFYFCPPGTFYNDSQRIEVINNPVDDANELT